MNEFVLDRIACSLEKIAKSAANIETEMKKQTALLEPLSGCVYVSSEERLNWIQTDPLRY